MAGPRAACVVLLLLSVSLSGCLVEDVWREPFVWRPALDAGEGVDGARALAAAFGDLGDRAGEEGEDVVVETARDLPDGVVFQNARDFLEQYAPGSGEAAEEQVRMAADDAGDAYVTLTGQAAAAYEAATGPVVGTEGPVVVPVPERTTRVRVAVDVLLQNEAPENGTNPAPANKVHVVLTDARGAVRLDLDLERSLHRDDLWVVGTYGGANEVREHLGGDWILEVDASGEGAWSVVVEAFEPEFDDWRWYEVWRAERRHAGDA